MGIITEMMIHGFNGLWTKAHQLKKRRLQHLQKPSPQTGKRKRQKESMRSGWKEWKRMAEVLVKIKDSDGKVNYYAKARILALIWQRKFKAAYCVWQLRRFFGVRG